MPTLTIGPIPPLTPREREVDLLKARGLTNAQIAKRLGCSLHTVRAHLRSITLKTWNL